MEQKIKFVCTFCKKEFTRTLSNAHANTTGRVKNPFCSQRCNAKHRSARTNVETTCTNCGVTIFRTFGEVKKNKSGKFFCSHSCSASYQNTHKTFGNRRSKLENYIEDHLCLLYPGLEIIYNGKEIIGSELDVYIPSLRLAIEINGIFHYQPVFGEEKLRSIQSNDTEKLEACRSAGISLVVLDTSDHKYITAKTCKKYLDKIVKVIEKQKSG